MGLLKVHLVHRGDGFLRSRDVDDRRKNVVFLKNSAHIIREIEGTSTSHRHKELHFINALTHKVHTYIEYYSVCPLDWRKSLALCLLCALTPAQMNLWIVLSFSDLADVKQSGPNIDRQFKELYT